MSDAERLPLTRFLPELERLKEAGADFILIAGQAVNFWSDYYKDREPNPALLGVFTFFIQRRRPFRTNVADLYTRLGEILDLVNSKRYRDVQATGYWGFYDGLRASFEI